ncbi:translocation/assembly module TamB [Flavobacteriaceae bacterium TP-CH-4]|uniref:Translocation/assembly module TamB n=1 Tax=Pelagihabitans pacificus TaxID=2696054 RepID=A0A967AV73_9FLAO|nr:translocation/assembly module TamB domain-containing protein [Pelagihabitans pacificus]NHF60996.1 translocation/assembly module TamB [Pelagihabitans pacificus]
MNKKKRIYRILKRIAKGFAMLFLLCILIILFIRSPWGQRVIKNQLVSYVVGQTGAKMTVDKLFVTFSGDLELQGLYLADLQNDTLLYSKNWNADLAFGPLLFGNTLQIEELEWTGVVANITRDADTEEFNFTFLLDAFALEEPEPEEENTEPMSFEVQSIALTDFRIRYLDQFLGVESDLEIGKLQSGFEKLDLERLQFHFDETLLSDSNLSYLQSAAFPETAQEEDSPLPQLTFEEIGIKGVELQYRSLSESLSMNAMIDRLTLGIPTINLDTDTFEIDELSLSNSKIALELTGEMETAATKETEVNPAFSWPDIRIKASNIDISRNEFIFNANPTTDSDSIQNVFDPNQLHVTGLGFTVSVLDYRPKQLRMAIERFEFEDKSGLALQTFQMKGTMNEERLRFSDLHIQTSESSIQGSIALDYESLNKLLNQPGTVKVDAELPYFKIGLKELLVFQPNLATNELFMAVAESPFVGRLMIQGTMAALALENTEVTWGDRTSLDIAGILYQPTSIDSLHFDINNLQAVSSREDLQKFPALKDSLLTLPDKMVLSGKASGSLSDVAANVNLESTLGSIRFKGRGGVPDIPFVNGTVTVDSLELGTLLNNPEFGLLQFTVDASLSGEKLSTLDGNFDLRLALLEWSGYRFDNLSSNGKIDDGQGTIDLAYTDINLNFDSRTAVRLDSADYDVSTTIDLKGADLNALGLMEENVKIGAQIKGGFKGTKEDYTITSELSEVVSVRNDEQFQTGDIMVNIDVGPASSTANIESDFLKARLNASGTPNQIIVALRQQFEGYFEENVPKPAPNDSLSLSMNASLTPEPILTEVFLKGITRLDSVSMNASYSAATKKIHAELHLPYAEYQGALVDSLHFTVDGDATNLSFSSGLASLQYEPVHIKKTYFEGKLGNQELLLDFLSYDEDEKLMHVASEMRWVQDTLQLHIDPTELIFKKKPWSIPDNNLLVFSKNNLHFEQMRFSRNDQLIELSDAVSGIATEHLGILFSNFRLQTFLSLFNPDESLVSGKVQGKLILENPFTATGLIADMQIEDLGLLDNRLGNLDLEASSQGPSDYELDLALKDGGILLDLSGEYRAAAQGAATLDLLLDIEKLETAVIAGFLKGDLAKPKGYLSGKFDLMGTMDEPIYKGTLSFNDTAFEVVPLDTTFEITDETVTIDEKSVRFGEFTIRDAKGSFFTVEGSIDTENIPNPGFDLNFKTEEFRLLDSTKEDNELYYGIASIDADVDLKGTLDLPELDGRLRIRKVTELTYVVPEEQLDIEERDGVVIFVNRENPNAILTRSEERSAPDLFRGFDISLLVEVAEDALFSVVLDEKTGDVLQVAGDATLNLNLSPNGSVGLTGKYELTDGYYRTSLYNLVSRRFDINPGSTITWKGDPMDADLDVTAIYRVETSAAPLMATETSGVEAGLAAKYQQVMPFLVYLNVDGALTSPKLSFDLGIPESAQGDLGGAVYGKVQQLNEQETELNKQVFSLLALNRFFPNTGSDGSSGGAAGLARNNINKVLSGELNAFSDKVLGDSGFELDFDLDSFTDYSGESAQDRTQLNVNARKRLFDDRLIVTAGSAIDVEGSAQAGQEETPIIGNVSLEYLLTENGRYRLKGFRKSEYVNVIDGQLIVTGLALIFDREFNSFSELFNPLKTDSKTTPQKEKQPTQSKKKDD